jgi:hypothetical protein
MENQQGIGWDRAAQDVAEGVPPSDSEESSPEGRDWPSGPEREPSLRLFALCGSLIGAGLGAWFGYEVGRPDPASYLSGASTTLAVLLGLLAAFFGLVIGLLTWLVQWHAAARRNTLDSERRQGLGR